MQENSITEAVETKANFKEENLKKIKHTIIVLSNKGGVGKSTVSTNIAYGLSLKGYKTGILDADIHGPSINKMMGIEGQKLIPDENGNPVPIRINDNLYALSSSAFLDNSDQPLIWRGPLKMRLLTQFIEDFYWPELDYLIVDCPPGTGDEPLSIIQLFDKIDYAVIVTTPQEIALLDSRKAINFLKKLDVKNIGIIENMSGLICPHCNNEINVFNKNTVEKIALEYEIEMLGNIPIEHKITERCDSGKPYIGDNNEEETSKTMYKIIDHIKEIID